MMKRFFTIFIIFSFTLNGLFPVCSAAVDYSEAERERRLGNLFDYYAAESFVMLRDEQIVNKITGISDKIARASDHPEINFRVSIINDTLPVVSAFPGYLYVSTGMLNILGNEDELAAVIAHAIAHVVEKDQYDTYKSARKMKKIAFVTGSLMPLLVFSGVGVAAIAGGGIAAATASTVEAVIAIGPVFYAASSIIQTDADQRLPGRVSINRLGPYLLSPDEELNLSLLVFFEEIYGGYKNEKEIKADKLSIGYLNKAGYKPRALVSVLKRLSAMRNENISKGFISHLLITRPGMEERIVNAEKLIKDTD